MTHSGGKPHAVGDKGQRYEVRCIGITGCDDDGEAPVGWTDNIEVANRMVSGVNKHPSWHSPRIVDRKPT